MTRARLPALVLPWLGYVVLVVAGWLSGSALLSLLALAVLAAAVALPGLRAGRIGAWVGWLAAEGVVLLAGVTGWGELLLEAVPIVISALLAWWFARSLRGQPLVARCIAAIDGEVRLAERGVAAYARGLTLFWAVLMTLQALTLAVLWLCADGSGVLARLGVNPPLGVDARWARAWLHVGGYALLPLVFVLEYAWRRWHLRHLRHAGLITFVQQLVRNWPRLLHESGATRVDIGRSFVHAFSVAPDHPALAGHFPGNPLVPGVMLLEQVAQALRASDGRRLARVVQAKFVAPLRPGQQAVVRLRRITGDKETRMRFEIARGDTLLATGIIEGAA